MLKVGDNYTSVAEKMNVITSLKQLCINSTASLISHYNVKI